MSSLSSKVTLVSGQEVKGLLAEFIKEGKPVKIKPMIDEVLDVADEIIRKCGIRDHITDIFLASPSSFTDDWEPIRKKLGLPEHADEHMNIASIALMVIMQRRLEEEKPYKTI